jgi:hypothetical protein
MLAGEDPAIVEHLARLADEARSLRDAALAGTPDTPDERLSRSRLLEALPAARRVMLSRWTERLTAQRPTRAHLVALERVARDGRGEVLLPRGWVASAEGEELRLDRRAVRTRSRKASARASTERRIVSKSRSLPEAPSALRD